jgi:hypothetical protein
VLALVVLYVVIVVWALLQVRNGAMRGTQAAVAIFGLLLGIACLSWGLSRRSLAIAAVGAGLEFLTLALLVFAILTKSIQRNR